MCSLMRYSKNPRPRPQTLPGGFAVAVDRSDVRLDELVKTREKGWHIHVTDERFWSADEHERVEREVSVYRSDDETASF